MLTWALVWFCNKAKGDPKHLLIIAMCLDTWILISFAKAIEHLK